MREHSVLGGDTEGSYQECPHQVDRKGVEQRILIRRRAVILSLVTIFLVTTIMLVISVVHDEMNKSNVGYQELVCQETDVECFELLCPQGWSWSRKKEECELREGELGECYLVCMLSFLGYSCCPLITACVVAAPTPSATPLAIHPTLPAVPWLTWGWLPHLTRRCVRQASSGWSGKGSA
jgi:hypothetical protein